MKHIRLYRLEIAGVLGLVVVLVLSWKFLYPLLTPHSPLMEGVIVEPQPVWESGTTAAAKAGLQDGDMILGWSRSASHGRIESPFDLIQVDTEQRPLGAVVLEGWRGREKKSWKMGPGGWYMVARPALSGDLLTAYQQSQKLRKAGAIVQAASQLAALAGRPETSNPNWLRPWLLSRAADWLSDAKKWKEADAAYEKALHLAPAAGPNITASLWRDWGEWLANRNEQTRAAESYARSIAASEKLPAMSMDTAKTLEMLAYTDRSRGNMPEAEDHFRQALAIMEKRAPVSLDFAACLNGMGVFTAFRGDLARGEEYYRQALAIQEQLAPGTDRVAMTLLNTGVVASMRGNLVKAEEYYRQSRALFEKGKPGNSGIAATAQGLGIVSMQRGDWAKAEEYHRQALTIWHKIYGDSLDVAAGIANLGEVAWEKGDFRKAEEYYRQALAIQERVAPGSASAESCDNLGKLARQKGDGVMAEKQFRKALALNEKLAPGSLNVASSLSSLGEVFRDRGDLTKAEEYDLRALAIQEKLAPGSIDEAQTLYALASTLLQHGKGDRALVLFERAVNALETQTTRLGGTEELRSGYSAQNRKYYRDYLAALLARKQPERAFQILERSRARSLLAMLAERDLVFAADLPPDIQHERKINAGDYDRIQAQIATLDPAKDAVQIEKSLAQLRDLAAEREQLTERVKRISPRFAALQYPKPLDLRETRQALDPGTVLLSYSIDENQSTLFVVQPNGSEPGLSVHPLPAGEKALRSRVEEFRRLIGEPNTANSAVLNERSRELYDLLIKPAEAEIAKDARLLIAPDGPLHILPFAALVREHGQYLVEWKPIHTVVSATIYAELKKTRGERRASQFQLAAFGDPHYPTLASQIPQERSSTERGLILARLPFSRDEVTGIAALYPKQAETYLGAEATEERARSISAKARYVHFAVHGFFDERLPLNSGLAMTIPEKPAAGQQNGLLQAWEIFEQVRFEADLVVLSACQTGLGKELGGEGLIGLTRAFQYAGARSIAASLWSVDDLKTAQLMTHFYAGLKQGKSKDEALRLAQMALLSKPGSSHPYYWAAFSLIGDWQ
jgi:CHAT domain-containing protein